MVKIAILASFSMEKIQSYDMHYLNFYKQSSIFKLSFLLIKSIQNWLNVKLYEYALFKL